MAKGNGGTWANNLSDDAKDIMSILYSNLDAFTEDMRAYKGEYERGEVGAMKYVIAEIKEKLKKKHSEEK
jgi:hypothetical protein